MSKKNKLIVMLTNNDKTVMNASEIFEQCKDSKAEYWGFKEMPLPVPEMKRLYSTMKECGKHTVLEVVSYNDNECLKGAELAVECNCDILMGTIYSDRINNLCKENGIKYMPFVGEVSERPSVLNGSIDGMIDEARNYISKGAYGIDLLGYRFTGDASELIRRFVSEVNAPVCIAGSVDSFSRLDEIKAVSPDFFTIGSAFFNRCFGDNISGQIDKVCDYIC